MNAQGTLDGAADTVEFEIGDGFAEDIFIQLVGTPTTPVVVLELSADGTTWVAVQVVNLNTAAAAVNMTAAGVFRASGSGARKGRLNMVSVVAGAFTAFVRTVRA